MHTYSFEKLEVWKESIQLSIKIYKITRNFPDDEKFGLISQMRRSSISISSNIAEGAGRNSKKDFNNFLGISHGSSCELGTQLIIAQRINFIDQVTLESMLKEIDEIQKMNWSLKKSLKLTQD